MVEKVDPPDPFDCKWCRKKCVISAELKRHMRSCKSGRRLTVQEQRLSKEHQVHTTKPKRVYCSKCSKSFLSLKNLQAHHQEKHAKKQLPLFKCSTCNRRRRHSFKTIGALLVHIKAKHKDLSVFTCYNCEKTFKTTPTFKQHLKYHAGGAPNTIKCLQSGCKQVFTAPGQIREHMKVHDGMEQCKVNGCTFKSWNQSGMRLHKSSVHAIWAHCCQLCGKGFYWPTYLKQHMDEHEKLDKNAVGKELHCAVSGCQETFTRCIDLETHAARNHQSHSSEKMASSSNSDKKCHLCGVTVNGELRDLWEHTLKHEKQIPGVFPCTFKICSQKFYSAADLQQHTEKHYLGNKLQPQSCDFPNCTMTFRSIQGLQLHKHRKHGKEVVTTNACHLCTMQVEHALCVSYHTYSSRNEAMSQAEAPEVAGAQYVLVSKEDGVEEVVFISNPS